MHNRFASIRWKILFAFLLIVGVSYYFVADALIGLVGDYLFDERMRQDTANTQKLAEEVTPLYLSSQMAEMQTLLESAGKDLGGRLMVLDMSGKVQCDSQRERNGSRMEVTEVANILSIGKPPMVFIP